MHLNLISLGMMSPRVILAIDSSRLALDLVARKYSSSASLSQARVVILPDSMCTIIIKVNAVQTNTDSVILMMHKCFTMMNNKVMVIVLIVAESINTKR